MLQSFLIYCPPLEISLVPAAEHSHECIVCLMVCCDCDTPRCACMLASHYNGYKKEQICFA